MLSIKTNKISSMKSLISAINSAGGDGGLKWNNDEITMFAIDPAQVFLVNAKIPKAFFEEYKNEDESVAYLQFGELKKYLSRSKEKDTLEIAIKEKLNVKINSSSNKEFSCSFLNNIISEKYPKINASASITIKGDVLSDAIKDIKMDGVSFLDINLGNNGMKITSEGDVTHAETVVAGLNIISLKIDDPAKMQVSLEFLEKATSSIPDSADVKLSFSTNTPISIEYAIENCLLQSFIAPRIVTE